MLTSYSSTETEKKLRSFLSLPVGWCYGDGVPAKISEIVRGQVFLAWFTISGLVETDAFCSADGDVMVTAYQADHYLEVDLTYDGAINFRHLKGEAEVAIEPNVTMSDALTLIQEAVLGFECSTLELSIPAPSIVSVINSKLTLSKIPLQSVATWVQAYSSTTAPKRGSAYVSTFANSTPKSAETPQYSGYSMNQMPHLEVA